MSRTIRRKIKKFLQRRKNFLQSETAKCSLICIIATSQVEQKLILIKNYLKRKFYEIDGKTYLLFY